MLSFILLNDRQYTGAAAAQLSSYFAECVMPSFVEDGTNYREKEEDGMLFVEYYVADRWWTFVMDAA